MARISPDLPTIGDKRGPEEVDIRTALAALLAEFNGNIDSTNVKAAAGFLDGQLASPNSVVYRTLLEVSGRATTGAADVHVFGNTGVLVKAGNDMNAAGATSWIHFAAGDYTVASKTQKLRVRAQLIGNAIAPGVTFTIGMYPIDAIAGAPGQFTFTVGTVVPGSTVVFATPGIGADLEANSGDFTIPADGRYVLAAAVSGAMAANSVVGISAQLQTHHV